MFHRPDRTGTQKWGAIEQKLVLDDFEVRGSIFRISNSFDLEQRKSIVVGHLLVLSTEIFTC